MIGIKRRTIRRSAAAIHSAGRTRSIVIELRPPGDTVGFRLERTGTTYFLPVDWCYKTAMRAELERRKAERRRERAAHGGSSPRR